MGDCVNGTGTKYDHEVRKLYRGGWKSGKAHGRGTEFYAIEAGYYSQFVAPYSGRKESEGEFLDGACTVRVPLSTEMETGGSKGNGRMGSPSSPHSISTP